MVKGKRKLGLVWGGLLFMLVLAVLSTVGAFSSVYASQIADEPEVAVQRTVDVMAGDTLYQIAKTYCPDGENPRSYMKKIMKANGLAKSDLYEGQILLLP